MQRNRSRAGSGAAVADPPETEKLRLEARTADYEGQMQAISKAQAVIEFQIGRAACRERG